MQHQAFFKRQPLAFAVATLLAFGVTSTTVQAAIRTWDGNGGSNVWSYINSNPLSNTFPNIYRNTNWTDQAFCLLGCSLPLANGDALVFDGVTRLTPNNDLTDRSYAGLSFAANAGAFTLNGNAITSTGNITNNSSNLQTINMPIMVGSHQIWDGGSKGLKLNGSVTLGSYSLRLSNGTAIDNQASNFIVGDSGTAGLSLQSGSSVSNNVGYGYNSGNVAGATVSGANSLWTNSSSLYVGNDGRGLLDILNGGKVTNTNGYLGLNINSSGTVTVSDMNSLWENSETLSVGYFGSGTLNIKDGGKVKNTEGYLGIIDSGTGTALVDGIKSSWDNSSSLYIGYIGNGTLTIQNEGNVRNTYAYLGYISGSNGTATVEGVNSLWANNHDLLVGFSGSGTLNIKNGGRVNNASGTLGFKSSSAGTATVDGVNSLWTNRLSLFVGVDGSGTLNVQNGGAVKVDRGLSIGSNGKLVLNGGSLSAATASLTSGGQFDWLAGTLNLGSMEIGATNSLLGDTLNLDASHILNVSGDASLTANAFVRLSGSDFNVGGNLANDGILNIGAGRLAKANDGLTNTGSIVNRGTLQGNIISNSGSIQLAGSGKIIGETFNLNGGGIQGSALDMTSIGQLIGYGSISAAISGGTAANTIQADGGNLDLGSSNSTSGFDFGGNLIVGSHQVNLLDTDQANLGTSTTIGNGGRLNAANGTALGSGETLEYTGNASILGNFSNNGAVTATPNGGTLTFLNDVNGAGSFAGNIVFHAEYNPGNSPAAVDFNGGNATYDATSVLTMEIFGNTPGSQYDQLLNIDHLAFDGILNLVFGPAFTPDAGQSFALFDFNSFSGSLAADRITVSGIDRNRLNLSSLASNGRLQIAAVPLPGGVWLFGSGLALLGLARRKRVG